MLFTYFALIGGLGEWTWLVSLWSEHRWFVFAILIFAYFYSGLVSFWLGASVWFVSTASLNRLFPEASLGWWAFLGLFPGSFAGAAAHHFLSATRFERHADDDDD